MDKRRNGCIIVFSQNDEKKFCYENDKFFLDIAFCSYCDKKAIDWTVSQPELHRHDIYEMQMILDGECQFELENRDCIMVSAGQFLLFPPKVKHRIIAESDSLAKFMLGFRFIPQKTEQTNFYQTAAELALRMPILDCSEHMKYLANTIITSAEEKHHEYVCADFFLALSCIIEMFSIIVGNTEIRSNVKYGDTRINKAIEYIMDNISATMTVSEVAQQLPMSNKQFTRIFTEAVGTTPGAYIKDYRIRRVCELLRTPDLYIEDIVSIMGYSDATAMIKAFKKAEGITPMQYKKIFSKSS